MRNQSFHLKMNDFPDCESLEAHADERSRLQFRVSTFPLNCVIINIDLSNGRGGGGSHDSARSSRKHSHLQPSVCTVGKWRLFVWWPSDNLHHG